MVGASAPFHMHVPSGCTLCCHCRPLLLKGRTANAVCLLVMWPPWAAVGLGSLQPVAADPGDSAIEGEK